MRDTKSRLNLFSFFDFPSITASLEKMAAEGWMLVKADTALWKYRRMEPRRLRFAITYFPKATNIDPEPYPEQRTLWEFCERTGWKLAAQSAQMQIFYNEGENPVPIDTDPVVQVENIHKSAVRNLVLGHGVLFLLAAINLAMLAGRAVRDPIGVLVNTGSIISFLCWLLVIALCAAEACSYFSWYRRAREAAAEGWLALPKGTRRLQAAALVLALVLLAFWLLSSARVSLPGVLFGLLYAAAIFGMVRGMMALLKRLKAPAKVNMAVTIIASIVLSSAMIGVVVQGILGGRGMGWLRYPGAAGTYQHNGMEWAYYDDELPLYLRDLTDVEEGGYSRRYTAEGTFLLERIEGYERPRFDAENYSGLPELEYTVLKVKRPFLYDRAREELMREHDDVEREWVPEGMKDIYQPADPAAWGAGEAYRLVNQEMGPREHYLICYEDSIVALYAEGFELTPERMAIAAEKLGGA